MIEMLQIVNGTETGTPPPPKKKKPLINGNSYYSTLEVIHIPKDFSSYKILCSHGKKDTNFLIRLSLQS